jgi:hypothetical protein
MSNIKYIYVDSHYEYTLEIVFTHNVKRSLKHIYKKWGIEEEIFDCEGCTVTCMGSDDEVADITKYALIFKYDKLTENLIAHELCHLAAFILTDRSIDLAGGNDDYENFAWLSGALSEIVHQIIIKQGITIHPTKIQPKLKKIG